MASLRETIMDGAFDAPGLLTLNELAASIKTTRSLSTIVAQVWALQKTGELTFKERKGQSTIPGSHHGGDLVDIALTPYGVRNVKKRRGIATPAAEHDRPFVKVTHEELLSGIGMKPIEPKKNGASPEKLVAAEILAERVGFKVVNDDQIGVDRFPGEARGFRLKPIHAPDNTRHPVGKDMTDAKQHGQQAEGGTIQRRKADRPIPDAGVITPIITRVHAVGVDGTDHHTQPDIAPVAPLNQNEKQYDAYPLLTSLRQSLVKRIEAEARAETLLQAAAMVENLAPEQAEALQRQADIEVAPYNLSTLQAEYLKYAEEHA